MHGVKRVIIFCILIVILPATLIIIPLYLKHSIFADVTYAVAESDIIEIRDGISSIFCQQHSLRMNTSFNAFQLHSKPEISKNRKHIRLKKSMTLPDDTLEYWGFYLLKGAVVELKVCSRYEGSRILVVKGERDLRTCGLLEHNKNKVGAHFAQGHEKVRVTFETVAEIVMSKETQAAMDNPYETIKSGEATNPISLQNEEKETVNHAGEDLSDDEILDGTKTQPQNTRKEHSNAIEPNNGNRDEVDSNKADKKNIDGTMVSGIAKENKTEDNSLVNVNSNKTTNTFNQSSEIGSNRNHETEMIGDTGNVKNIITVNRRTEQDEKYDAVMVQEKKDFEIINHETLANEDKIVNRTSDSEIFPKIRHRRHHHHQNLKNLRSGHGHAVSATEADSNRRRHNYNHQQKSAVHSIDNESIERRLLRQKRDHVYDRKISHGGNAFNVTENLSGSISSFENSLLTCYTGKILLAQKFPPSSQCSSVRFLDSGTHMVSRHEVVSDGYYYYIFYSDNDLVRNDIHAIFDIFKPTFQYSNISDSQGCVNRSNCTFPIKFMSDEIVIVEVPTRDGIEHEEDDVTYLISTCQPRMAIYVIFPIAVLILILSCAFL